MKDQESCHFWVGHFRPQFAERYFAENNDRDDDETPVSAFARDQGIAWVDHDLLEHGWHPPKTIQEMAVGHSYGELWSEELAKRVQAAGLKDVNLIVFIHEE